MVMWVTPVFYLWLLPTRAELEHKLKAEETDYVEMEETADTSTGKRKASDESMSVDQY